MDALKGMVLIDEIRGRLCEVFSLKSYKIDHVVHGAIATAVYMEPCLGQLLFRSNMQLGWSSHTTFHGEQFAQANNLVIVRALVPA